MLPRQGKAKGLHHHEVIIIWNVTGTYLRKRRRSKLWILRWQQIHNYQHLNLKKQIKQTSKIGTESDGDHLEGYQLGGGKGRMGEKVQGLRNIISRNKIDKGMFRIV